MPKSQGLSRYNNISIDLTGVNEIGIKRDQLSQQEIEQNRVTLHQNNDLESEKNFWPGILPFDVRQFPFSFVV